LDGFGDALELQWRALFENKQSSHLPLNAQADEHRSWLGDGLNAYP
jgi:hypothetical protein